MKVSSSKKISFICGNSRCISFTSSNTFSALRVRYEWPVVTCGHRQKVQRAGQPRPVYSDTYGYWQYGLLYFR